MITRFLHLPIFFPCLFCVSLGFSNGPHTLIIIILIILIIIMGLGRNLLSPFPAQLIPHVAVGPVPPWRSPVRLPAVAFGGRPNDGSFPTEAWFDPEGNPVLPSCYSSEVLVWGSMVSGRKSVCAAAGAR
ncbi:hypothetical protein Hanom_Chr15g01358881 [Helianthus anomalus]